MMHADFLTAAHAFGGRRDAAVLPALLFALLPFSAAAGDYVISDGETVTEFYTLSEQEDTLTIEPGGILAPAGTGQNYEGAVNLKADDQFVINNGIIETRDNQYALRVYNNADNAVFINNGTINPDYTPGHGGGTGSRTGIASEEKGTSVENNGELNADKWYAVNLAGGSSRLVNNGTIRSSYHSVQMSAGNSVLINNGSIISDGTRAVSEQESSDSFHLYRSEIINTGVIMAHDLDGDGNSTGDGYGIFSGSYVTLTNSGTIKGTGTAIINYYDDSVSGQMTLNLEKGSIIAGPVVFGVQPNAFSGEQNEVNINTQSDTVLNYSSPDSWGGNNFAPQAYSCSGALACYHDTANEQIVAIDTENHDVPFRAGTALSARLHDTLSLRSMDRVSDFAVRDIVRDSSPSGTWTKASLYYESDDDRDTDFRTVNLIAGFDRKPGPGTGYGIYGMVASGSHESDAGDDTVDVLSFHAGGYIDRIWENGSWVHAAVSAGYGTYDGNHVLATNTDSDDGLETVTYDTSTVSVSPSLTAGKRFGKPALSLTPSLRVRYDMISTGSYEEEGLETVALNKAVDSRLAHAISGRLQLALETRRYTGKSRLLWRARAGADFTTTMIDDLSFQAGDTQIVIDDTTLSIDGSPVETAGVPERENSHMAFFAAGDLLYARGKWNLKADIEVSYDPDGPVSFAPGLTITRTF